MHYADVPLVHLVPPKIMEGKMRQNATKVLSSSGNLWSSLETYNHEFHKYTGVWTNNQCFITDILVFEVDSDASDGA